MIERDISATDKAHLWDFLPACADEGHWKDVVSQSRVKGILENICSHRNI